MRTTSKSLAIACPSGSFKGAFAHGVLSALEAGKIRGDAYAATSDFTKATEEGLAAIYQHGQQKGQEFIESGGKVHLLAGG